MAVAYDQVETIFGEAANGGGTAQVMVQGICTMYFLGVLSCSSPRSTLLLYLHWGREKNPDVEGRRLPII